MRNLIAPKQKIIVSIPLVWGIRNVFNSGLIGLLENELEIYVAVPAANRQSVIGLGFPDERILSLCIPKSDRFNRNLLSLLKNAHKNHKSTVSDQIFSDWRGRNQNSIRNKINTVSSRVFGKPSQFAWLENIYLKRMIAQVPAEMVAQIARIHPAAGLSTSYVANWEWPLFTLLQKMGVPTATHILSFDNLTSRGYFPMTRFDRYYTWQQDMGMELTRYFGIEPERIQITGTPQFDFHILPNFSWDRPKTASMLGIDPEQPYLAYCANHLIHTPGEPKLINQLIKTVRATERFHHYQWVIRLHPMDQYERWESLFATVPGVVISHPWNHKDKISYWGVPNDDELALLGNTLRHASAAITMASTVALDSCVVDTPIICVGFHPDRGSAEDRYYHQVHFSHHYAPIISSGAVAFVSNEQEFCTSLTAAVDHPQEKGENCKMLVEMICGRVDGKLAWRLAEAVKSLVSLH